MGIGEPKMPTPEEMAKLQKERTLSDSELIKDGAEYVGEDNNLRLDVTDKQIEDAKGEMNAEKEAERREATLDTRIENLKRKFEEIEQYMNYVREKVDFQTMSEEDFTQFENNYANLLQDLSSASFQFFNKKNDMKVTHDEWEKWQNEKK